MFSRKTTILLGTVYADEFGSYLGEYGRTNDSLYDFLFACDFSAWFCNASRSKSKYREIKDFVMKLHTGETVSKATENWSWQQRQQLGQTYLELLAAHIWNHPVGGYSDQEKRRARKVELAKHVQLDGYKFVDGRLIPVETDVLDADEQAGLLETMFKKLELSSEETSIHCLRRSEQAWIEANWDDCISNARRFMESTLREVAAKHAADVKGETLSESIYSRPVRVRDYLEEEGLIERQEKKAIAEIYGLLSVKGSHPNIAQQDQARLLRQVALIFSHFVMIRLEAALVSAG